MKNEFQIHPSYRNISKDIKQAIVDFDTFTQIIGDGGRNVIKLITFHGEQYAFKSFKVPNLINRFVYKYIRKSKAERSYLYANKLVDYQIGTPLPICYAVFSNWFGIKKSYYISKFSSPDLTYRELTTDFSIEDHEAILRAFTRFTYNLHQNQVHFLDHSPGNTLVTRVEGGYDFALVDLNRMEFGEMDFETRVKNFSKLTIHRSMIEVMSNEYAKCTGEDEQEIFNLMWESTKKFQDKYYRKIRIKKKVFFWKKKYKSLSTRSPIS